MFPYNIVENQGEALIKKCDGITVRHVQWELVSLMFFFLQAIWNDIIWLTGQKTVIKDWQ